MDTLQGKTIFISGGTRGIGEAIILKAARDGANIAIAAKTAEPHPKLPGTLYTVAEAIKAAGGQALPLQVDIRNEVAVQAAVSETAEHFGGIDICINNASALHLAGITQTDMKRFDLMQQINVRGTYAVSQACLPHLLKAQNPHILTLSPPINLDAKWFKDFGPYTMSKYAMSLCAMSLAEEMRAQGVASNALWPKTMVATAAVTGIKGLDLNMARKVDIMADAAYAILTKDSKTCTGNFFIDEEVLKEEGITDFDRYAINPDYELYPDLFLN